MFENVYTNPKAKGEERKAENILKELFHYYMDHPELVVQEYIERMWQSGETQERSVCDYIAGMTDQYAIAKFQEFFVPVCLEVLTDEFLFTGAGRGNTLQKRYCGCDQQLCETAEERK